MTATEIYWIMQMDNIITGLLVLAIIGTLYGVLWIVSLVENYKMNKKTLKFPVLLIICSCMSGITVIFLPSTKTMATMYALPKIINNKEVQLEAEEIYALVKQGIKKLVEEEIK